MTRKQKRKLRHRLHSSYLWHRYFGIAAAAFVLILAVTGIVLNHTDRLRLSERYVDAGWLLDWYGLHAPDTVTSFKVGNRWITLLGEHLYFDQQEISGKRAELVGALRLQDAIVVAVDGELLLLTEAGEVMEQLGVEHGVPAGLSALGRGAGGVLVVRAAHGVYQTDNTLSRWRHPEADAGDVVWVEALAPPAELRAKLAEAWRGRGLPLERVLLDLHSGRILGGVGVWIMDGAAVLLVLLAFTGTWMWFRRRR